jgi:hypothetical protein
MHRHSKYIGSCAPVIVVQTRVTYVVIFCLAPYGLYDARGRFVCSRASSSSRSKLAMRSRRSVSELEGSFIVIGVIAAVKRRRVARCRPGPPRLYVNPDLATSWHEKKKAELSLARADLAPPIYYLAGQLEALVGLHKCYDVGNYIDSDCL